MNEKNRDDGKPTAGAKWEHITNGSGSSEGITGSSSRASRKCGTDVANIQQRKTSKGLLFVAAENSQTGGEAEESNLDDISLSRDQRVYKNGSRLAAATHKSLEKNVSSVTLFVWQR